MGRWLALAVEEEKKSKVPITDTDKTDKTPSEPVSSVLSVADMRESEKFLPDPVTGDKGVLSVLSVAQMGECEIFSAPKGPVHQQPPVEFDNDHLQRIADKRNREATSAGITDLFCACGRLATLAWAGRNGREIWRCLDCLPPKGKA